MNEDAFINKGVAVIKQSNQDLTITARTVKSELPKYWERDYINQCIDKIDNAQHRMLLLFLWYSGLRITEALSVRKQDVNTENYTVTVRWLKSRKYQQRVAPLHPRLRDVLQVFMATLKAEERLFPISRQRAWQVCQKYLKGSPHQLRHSFAVNWLRCGGDIVVLHRVLGHSKIQTTMEYLKIVPIDQWRELQKINFIGGRE